MEPRSNFAGYAICDLLRPKSMPLFAARKLLKFLQYFIIKKVDQYN